MPIYLQYSGIAGKSLSTGKGPVHGMKLGTKTLAPATLAFEMQSESARDAASGLPTGKRQHKPIVITKETDSTSPVVLASLKSNHVIPKLNLNFLKTNVRGNTQPYFKIELTNATLAGYGRRPNAGGKPSHGSYRSNELEEFQLLFQKITYTNAQGGTSSTDDWDIPT